MRVAVDDTGPGIPPAERERIFRPFWSRDGGGTGLGLAIARELAAALGGRIGLKSSPGQGSRFELVLPARSRVQSESRAMAAAPDARRAAAPALAPRAALVALRPRQWPKNLLLFAGLLFAAKLGDAARWAGGGGAPSSPTARPRAPRTS